jgi:hypothetical protein
MTLETHHQATLIENAKLELDRAHRAALALDSGELRRGLQIARDSLREGAVPVPETPEPSVPSTDKLARLITFLDRALADLDAGKLAELGNLIEEARKELEA